ncbi:DEAD/DEAH box helicase [Cysteiniphilum litorale]|uniref:DEAD/DEAH box helicase n=1 Tax=Cysteiniphilum litorale TaxID=2056700 RepID=UPI003F88119F
MSFSSLGLSNAILSALTEQGYKEPSPIQQKAIPAVLSGRDVLAAAQTGTGKTAAFTLPILEVLAQGPQSTANQTHALILTPTRELAAQIEANIQAYSSNLHLHSCVVFGGVKINPQMMRLRKGADILVATPGRLLDLYEQNAIRFDRLKFLVLDEADRMLDMGFIHAIRKILTIIPKKRQNLMFSATFSPEIKELAKSIVHNPLEISVSPPNQAAPKVKHWIAPVDKKQKVNLLIKLIKTHNWSQVLVFSRTKHGANHLVGKLEKADIKSAAIHGNKSQGARTKALSDFKNNEVQVLVATDIAARGLDISQLPCVINFDLPNVPEDYVHRIGRTGRAGATGEAISLVSADEFPQLADIEKLLKRALERVIIDDFDPVHSLPQSNPHNYKTIKKVTPKKPKIEHRDGQKKPTRHPKGNRQRQNRSEKK